MAVPKRKQSRANTHAGRAGEPGELLAAAEDEHERGEEPRRRDVSM
ncbi:hypothetical protein [Curtobacterium sp. B8]|nr:hypothetical protein [Curtobacterium sp. B8]